ncbi:LPD7 domain-containing protein [Xenorhabdus sp. TS4]|uniref:LPD7 domain-containing protein n=1 Tax=Xenorhabdus sp. TS4 TaxID=1873483 RepID=UPI0016572121|nr:LPD7 domain-containing protein [Xenorhabdus sp. TS4]MBC8950075.1 DNA primase [Xenorhabdus sp. TS4]
MKATEPTYLVIPIEQLQEAKKQAGKLENGQNALEFDVKKKLWLARPGADLEKLSKWHMDTTLVTEGNHRQDFGDFIRAHGGKLKGNPVMNGKKQRISMVGDGPGKKSGVYVGHEDGYPNGWFVDHRDGGDLKKWSSKSARPDPKKLAHLKAIAAQEQLRRDRETSIKQNSKAKEVAALYNKLPQAGHNHPYLLRKGVMAAKGVHLDTQNNLIVPLSNVEGNIRTLQTIDPDGDKRLTTGGEKEGNFYVVGGTLKNGSPIIFAEGYSTATSAAMAIQYPVVMAVDSGNLVKVAQALHERYSDSPKWFLADDDIPKPTRPGNPGKEKASQAAELTGGYYILPIFTGEERQKGLTDFNDLHKSRGINALKHQLQPVITAIQASSHMEPPKMVDTPTKNQSESTKMQNEIFESDNSKSASNINVTPESSISNDDYADYSHIIEKVMEQEQQEHQFENITSELPKQDVPEPSEILEPATMESAQNEHDESINDDNIAPQEASLGENEPSDVISEPVSADNKQDVQQTAPTEVQQAQNSEATEVTETSKQQLPEPNPEKEKTQAADEDAKAWLNSSRASIEEMLSEDKARFRNRIRDSQITGLQNQEAAAAELAKEEEKLASNVEPIKQNEQLENAILIETSRQLAPIDLDALMQQITHEIANDGRSVKYLLSGEDAFVDHSNHIVMATAQSSQNDSMILAALLVAREHYRGRIELTGSDEFKQRAINLIAEYNLDVKMKNPQQQLMLDEAIKNLANEPTPNDTPTPVGSPVASIVTEPNEKSAPVSTVPSSELLAEMPPELRPTVLSQETPQNASCEESQAGITGTILGYGPAKYNFDPSESKSYYVHLRTAQGERYIWGKDLMKIMPESGLSKNDAATLKWLGSEEVSVLAKVKDDQGKVAVDENGVEKTHKITTHRNRWEVTSAIDSKLLVSNERQSAPPASLMAYDMNHFKSIQEQVIQLATKAGVTVPDLPSPTNDLLWFKSNGEGSQPPAIRPTDMKLPAHTQDAGTVLMKAMDSEDQLKLLLVKGLGEYIQGVVHYQGEYHSVLGKLCTRENGSRYLSLNSITSDGPKVIGYGNAINNEDGANNAFVFRLKDEKERLYTPLVDPAKCPPALHKQLGFTNDYTPPSQTSQIREDIVEHTAKPTPSTPRPGA